MKYVNWDLVKSYIEENPPVTNGGLPITNGEFGYSRIEKFYYYRNLAVLSSGDGYGYKFNDFDVVSYRMPYLGELQETNDIDILEYINYVMEHIKPELLENYKKDLEQYWANQQHNARPRSRHRAEKIRSLFGKCDSQNIEPSKEDILNK